MSCCVKPTTILQAISDCLGARPTRRCFSTGLVIHILQKSIYVEAWRLTPGIKQVGRIIANVRIKIQPAVEHSRILTLKSASGGIVESGAVVVEAGFGVRFAGGVLERVCKRAGRGG